MAKTYTLDEAAGRLGIPIEEFKRRWKTEWTTVRTFRDGGTVRFRSADIDELARSLGMASDPGSQLAPPAAGDKSSTEYLLTEEPLGDDIFSLSSGDSGKKKGGSKPADSDIRLEADDGPKSSRSRAGESSPTEELSLDLALPSSGAKKSASSSAKLRAPKSGPNLASPSSGKLGKKKSDEDSSSEFELSLDSDSDSFELTLNPDGSDEVDLGGSQMSQQSRQSGINLAKPSDSGVSLEPDSSDELELSLDEPATPSGRSLSGPKSQKIAKAEIDSDSEFELTLDDSGGSMEALAAEAQEDIFETDFEASPTEDAESGSEVVAVEGSDTDLENSDFDLALDESDIQAEDESASQVVLLDDESDEPRALSGKRRPADEDDEIDLEEEDAGAALRDVPRRRRDEVEDEEDLAPVREAKPKPWGALPVAVLLPAFILTFLGGLMSYELVRSMWAYSSGSKPGGSLVRGVADLFDMKPAD